jgi:hypothetical protein
MRTAWVWQTLTIPVALAATIGLATPAHGVAGSPADNSQASQAAKPQPGSCDREAENLVGQKAVRIGGQTERPAKIRHVSPKHPQLPPGRTVGTGFWVGEMLVDRTGAVAHIWVLREPRITPPFPPFNQAILDALQQWKYEPFLQKGEPVPICITVTVNIHWQ